VKSLASRRIDVASLILEAKTAGNQDIIADHFRDLVQKNEITRTQVKDTILPQVISNLGLLFDLAPYIRNNLLSQDEATNLQETHRRLTRSLFQLLDADVVERLLSIAGYLPPNIIDNIKIDLSNASRFLIEPTVAVFFGLRALEQLLSELCVKYLSHIKRLQPRHYKTATVDDIREKWTLGWKSTALKDCNAMDEAHYDFMKELKDARNKLVHAGFYFNPEEASDILNRIITFLISYRPL